MRSGWVLVKGNCGWDQIYERKINDSLKNVTKCLKKECVPKNLIFWYSITSLGKACAKADLDDHGGES